MMISSNYSRILSNMLLSSLGWAEAEEILRDRIEMYLDRKDIDLTADITFFHSGSLSEVVIKSDIVRKVMAEKGFATFIKAVKNTATARPNYPAIKNGDLFTVFLPDKTYKAVSYGGEIDSYQELDKFLDSNRNPHHAETDDFEDHYPAEVSEPKVYHIAHNKPNEFVFVLGCRDEYIVI